MRYAKPQLTSLGSSIDAILSGDCAKTKHLADNSTGCDPDTHISAGAYEADE